MLGRNGNIAYVRYDSHGRIVPGGPIISAKRPAVGLWQPVSYAIGNSVTSNSLRAFVRLDAYGRVVPSSLLLLAQAPSTADSGTSWLEINATYVPYVPTTTTTTTVPISTTSTTTTLVPGTTTTTTTGIPGSTTTTTTTINLTPVNFTVIPSCFNITLVAFSSNYSGGSGVYNPGTNLYATEQEALNGTFSSNQYNSQGYYFVGSDPTPGTYWVAIRDANNINNKRAKTVVFVPGEDCKPVSTTTTTTTAPPPPGTISFAVRSECLGNQVQVTTSQFNVVGSVTPDFNTCFPGTTAYLTQNEALNGSFSTTRVYYYSEFQFTIPSPSVTTTYWVAVQDITNLNNKLAKSFTVTPCPQVPYNSLYVGFRTINTAWVTFN